MDLEHVTNKIATSETVHLLARIGLSQVSNIGSILQEIFSFYFSSPLQKRIENYLIKLNDRLIMLERSKKAIIIDLAENDNFHTSLFQSFSIAAKITNEEKLNSLINAVTNIAMKIDIKTDLQYIFIEYINNLTPAHLTLLRFFSEQENELQEIESYEQLRQKFITKSMEIIEEDEFKLLTTHLIEKSLINISKKVEDFSDVQKESSFMLMEDLNQEKRAPMVRVTKIGNQFLRLISTLQE